MSTERWHDLFPRVFEPQLCDQLEKLEAGILTNSTVEHNTTLGCWLKRDDQGPCHTHKARGLLVQFAIEVANGARGFSISSSGNAALAAGAWSSRLGLKSIVFLSHKTAPAKIAAIVETGVPTVVTEKPKNFSRYAARYGGLVDLRPSKHTDGATGYRLLAAELDSAMNPPPSAIFCFCNSGLTIAGLYQGFQYLLRAGLVSDIPQIHAVQCSPSTVLAQRLGAEQRPEESPIAGALGAQGPVPVEAVTEAIAATGGSTWMVSNEEITALKGEAHDTVGGFAIESIAALAGFQRASARVDLGPRPLVVIAGRSWRESKRADTPPNLHRCDDYAGVRALLETLNLGRGNE